MNKPLGQSDPDVWRAIERVLARFADIQVAILFGSLAAGSQQPDSDLDIAVAGEQKLDAEQKSGIIAALAESLGRPVDLVDLRTVGEPLLGQVLTRGAVLVGQHNPLYPELIKRHLFDQADFAPYQRRILAERRRAWIGK